MKCFFAGSDHFSQKIAQCLLKNNVTIIRAIAPPDVPRGRWLESRPVPFVHWLREKKIPLFQPASLKDEEFLRQFQMEREAHPDAFFLLVSYGKIVPKKILEWFPERIWNVHPSLLPKYRGAAPVLRAIMAGETHIGVTILHLSLKPDEGDIILQGAPIPISSDATSGEVWETIYPVAEELVCAFLKMIEQNQPLPRIAQDAREATYAPKLQPEEMRIDPKRIAWEIHNQVRALNPTPGAYIIFRGQLMKIWRTRWPPTSSPYPPGTIWSEGKRAFLAAHNGALEILEVQMAGRKKISAYHWLIGLKPSLSVEFLLEKVQ